MILKNRYQVVMLFSDCMIDRCIIFIVSDGKIRTMVLLEKYFHQFVDM